MQVDLAGKVAIVTGGAQGIGRAIVEQLTANGAAVALVDLAADAAQATAAELSSQGRRAAAFVADVSNERAMRDVAEQVVQQFGRIDILVNNAGINTVKDRVPLDEYHREDWDQILRVDLTGVFVVSQAIIPRLVAAGGGRIVNIASVAGLVPLRLQSAFVAAKAGVVNLTRSMALELAPRGILVNCVAPGSVLTQGTRALFYGADGAYSERAASLVSHIPVGRPGTPEEIAHAVLFLVAPEASYVNGAVLTVDGGWTAGYHREW
ncbi:MAG TPA: 3-oxoacyl-ACP reductase family protein [Pirellulales bacterium]|jgi:NAD(P)-dependent dehydrogenase (short-subunit alcohol dehydrogenase family)